MIFYLFIVHLLDVTSDSKKELDKPLHSSDTELQFDQVFLIRRYLRRISISWTVEQNRMVIYK